MTKAHELIMNERKIAVWPDAVWRDATELDGMTHRGDDYRVITVHSQMPDEEVDRLAVLAANGAPDDCITDEVIWWMGG